MSNQLIKKIKGSSSRHDSDYEHLFSHQFESCAKYFNNVYKLSVNLFTYSALTKGFFPQSSYTPDGDANGSLSFFEHYGIFHVLKDSHRIFSAQTVCPDCNESYKSSHGRCKTFCRNCLTPLSSHLSTNVRSQIKRYCVDCNLMFLSSQCYDLHKGHTRKKFLGLDDNLTTCQIYPRCKECAQRHLVNVKCNEQYKCKRCQITLEYYPYSSDQLHTCYIQSLKKKMKKNKTSSYYNLIFYDIETRVDTKTKILIPNMICFQLHRVSVGDNTSVLIKKGSFSHDSCIESFIDNFFPIHPNELTFKYSALIAHNASRFDSYFIFKTLLKRRPWFKPDVIQLGTRLYKVSYPGFRVLFDSALLIPTNLKSFSNMFDIETVKGFFPHKFNLESNYSYSGPIPDKSFFDLDNFKSLDELHKFNHWYSTQKDECFDFWTELERYCHLDVELLALGCLKFRNFILSEFKVNIFSPFPPSSSVFTIAGLSMFVYRANFYSEPILLNVPHKRYSKKYSKASISYFNSLLNPNLIHVGNFNGEIKIGPFHIDCYDPTTRTIIEYQGCFWHGHNADCPVLSKMGVSWDTPVSTFATPMEEFMAKRSVNQRKTAVFSSLQDRRRMSELRKEYFIKWGYTVKERWECEKRRGVEKEVPLVCDLLNPGDAVRGGRTEIFTIHHRIAENDKTGKIQYFDVTSLYPYILSSQKYPTGPVKIYSGNNLKLSDWDSKFRQKLGIVKAQILPPRDLFLPVLPFCMKVNASETIQKTAIGESGGGVMEKIYYTLCRSCTERVALKKDGPFLYMKKLNQSYEVLTVCHNVPIQRSCTHSQTERSWWGCYTITELSLAIEKGYRLLELAEVWSFEDSSTDLFSDYIKKCFRMKLQNSGFPNWAQSEEDKIIYIEKIKRTEGIDLELKDIRKNPTGRAISKLMLNALYGKLLQRRSTQVKYATSATDVKNIFMEIEAQEASVGGGGTQIENVNVIDMGPDQNDIICFTLKSGDNQDFDDHFSKYTNVIVGAHVTSYARIHLYKIMSQLEPEQLLMTDTDSIIYSPGNRELCADDGMGNLKNEIEDDYGTDSRMIEFLGLAPKHYLYRVETKPAPSASSDEDQIIASSNQAKKINTASGNSNNEGEETTATAVIQDHLKIKGYRQSLGCQNILNFTFSKRMVFDSDLEENKLSFNELKRDKTQISIFECVREKKITATFDKRIVDVSTLKTFPIGYYCND